MDILVLGIGNILLQDEGIGVHLVERLRANCAFVIDLGKITSTMRS